MAFNGSGQFIRLYNWTNDANAGIDISSSRMDGEDNGYATGLSNCITKDGQQTVTADIPFNTHKITNIAAGTLSTDATNLGQVQAGAYQWAGAASGTDTIVLSLTPTLSAYTAGLIVGFLAAGANATTSVTVNINGLGAKSLTKQGATALAAGDIASANYLIFIWYDGTRFQLINPAAQGGLGTAAFLNVGTSANNIPQLDGSARLPAVDASLLINNNGFGVQTSIASAATTTLNANHNVLITGTTGITSFGSSASTATPIYLLEFNGALTLTYNATSLIIPGSANITTAAGDIAVAEYLGSGNWKIRDYHKINGKSTIAPAVTDITGIGTAASLNVGTSAGNIVQLDGSAKLPAVDGSQLTNLPSTVPTTQGAVGTYINGFKATVGNIAEGATIAGASLGTASISATAGFSTTGSSTPSGTWRVMSGTLVSNSGGAGTAPLCVRIV